MKTRRPECPRALDIPEHLMGRLSADDAARMEEHLKICPSCAKTAADFRRVLQRLQAADRPSPASPRAELAVRGSAFGQSTGATWLGRHRQLWPWAAAVLLTVIAARGLQALNTRSQARLAQRPDAAVESARAWLEQTQEPDGSWDTTKWGAQKQYRAGLTALALIAYMSGDPPPKPLAAVAHVERGISYLLSEQQPDGHFGPFGSCTPYNHALCTLALLEAYARLPRPEWKSSIDRALTYIQSGQRASGAWGYPRRTSDEGNSSITIWNIQVLQRAEELGWIGTRKTLDGAYAWLRSAIDETGRVGYRRPKDFPFGSEALTAGALLCALRDRAEHAQLPINKMFGVVRAATPETNDRPNYYSAYFLSRALTLSADSLARKRAEEWKRALVRNQSQAGIYRGSCEPGDQWSAAGGRIYTTAMALLAMNSE